MAKVRESGIPALHEWILRNESREKLIKAHIDLNVEHGKRVLAFLNGNRARREGKEIRMAPAKAKAKAVYTELKAKAGKNPPFKIFAAELTARYPYERWTDRKRKAGEKAAATPWVEDTIRDWWKKLNAGKTI